MPPKTRMSAKQQRFIEQYLIDPNAIQAAIKAGYSKRSAKSIGSENLAKPVIAAAIGKAQEARAKKAEISAEFVINSLRDIARRCQELEPVLDKQGRPTGTYRFDSAGANKALELLGKHLKLYTDKIDLRVIRSIDDLTEDEVDALLIDLQARLSGPAVCALDAPLNAGEEAQDIDNNGQNLIKLVEKLPG